MKLRVYLDTSVFSAYFDDRWKERQTETRAFWERLKEFEITTSDLTRDEIAQTPDSRMRGRFEKLLGGMEIQSVTDEMQKLAQSYIDAGAFTAVTRNDALHVAAAVLSRQDILLSWNFKHLVNRRRRAKVNEVNISLCLPTIEMLSPPEI